jgi:SAM-dependent methyltransferase
VKKVAGVMECRRDGVVLPTCSTPPLQDSITPAAPFDALAAEYDDQFTNTVIGRLMRQAVWRRLDARFKPGDHILELNCGTGADALFLARRGMTVLATDASETMVQVSRAKLAQNGVDDRVRVERLAIEELACAPSPLCPFARAGFDGALSNFGGLNCVADLRMVRDGLAAALQPGAFAVLCVMGPAVPWEWVWYLGHARPGKAFRRLRPGGVGWKGAKVHYPSIRVVRRAFAPAFRVRRVSALGAFLPPPYAESWARKHPRLMALLNHVERKLEALPGLAWLADHYVMELERLP